MSSCFFRAGILGALVLVAACGDDSRTGAPTVAPAPQPTPSAPSHRGSFAPPLPPPPIAQPLATRKVVPREAGTDARQPVVETKEIKQTVTERVVVRENVAVQSAPGRKPTNEIAGRGRNADPADEVAEALQPGEKPKGNTDAVEEVAGQDSPNFDPPEEVAGP